MAHACFKFIYHSQESYMLYVHDMKSVDHPTHLLNFISVSFHPKRTKQTDTDWNETK